MYVPFEQIDHGPVSIIEALGRAGHDGLTFAAGTLAIDLWMITGGADMSPTDIGLSMLVGGGLATAVQFYRHRRGHCE